VAVRATFGRSGDGTSWLRRTAPSGTVKSRGRRDGGVGMARTGGGLFGRTADPGPATLNDALDSMTMNQVCDPFALARTRAADSLGILGLVRSVAICKSTQLDGGN
jgi:hypothetical protein